MYTRVTLLSRHFFFYCFFFPERSVQSDAELARQTGEALGTVFWHQTDGWSVISLGTSVTAGSLTPAVTWLCPNNVIVALHRLPGSVPTQITLQRSKLQPSVGLWLYRRHRMRPFLLLEIGMHWSPAGIDF